MFFIIPLIVISLVSTQSTVSPVEDPQQSGIIHDIRKLICKPVPVCAGGKTYKNACAAIRAGRLWFSTGTCEEIGKCQCTEEYAPVCAEGSTYSNTCLAKCAGHKKKEIKNGMCEILTPCKCTKEYVPVCADGQTFGNACQAKCAGYKLFDQGSCTPKCSCSLEYLPVCSEDGTTYANPCLAKCDGKSTWKTGACRPDIDIPIISASMKGIDMLQGYFIPLLVFVGFFL